MAHVHANGLQLEYESLGDPSAPAIVLIMGLGRQLIGWPNSLCQCLLEAGYRVIRFDNRDAGLSTHCNHLGRANVSQLSVAKLFGWRLAVPYTLEDMADDALALMDALNIRQAHIAGSSLGAAIAQIIAGRNPERTLSLTCLLSTSDNPHLPGPKPKVKQALALPYAKPGDEQGIVERALKVFATITGNVHVTPEDVLRESYITAARRDYDPIAYDRQLAASIVAQDRRPLLSRVQAPTSVYHGDRDPLFPLECAKDVANHIADAELIIEPGLGHEMPPQLMPNFANAILTAAART